MARRRDNSSRAFKAFCQCLAALALGFFASIFAATADDAAVPSAGVGAAPLFESDIAPLLAGRCGRCHGADKAEAGLDLRQRGAIIAGGDSGTALVPGKLDESPLWERIAKGEMPPTGETPLTDAELAILRRWIEAGAPATQADESSAAPNAVRVSADDRAFWAFRPPVRPPVPTVNAQHRVRTPIDSFLLARLEREGLSFNDDAHRSVLLRRLCFDLHGLPPTFEQLDEFLADSSPDAYEQLVDRLLASPRYGERWGRHWLDVAGYADSDGYLAADRERPEAWRYRDYVIRALNADLPYDRFVKQQIAGDELSDWRRAEELSPEMIDELTATGFLRTASDPTYPGYTEKNECYQVVSDTIHIVSTTFLGLTIQCARCHAHKFDPISQRDYYSLQAILTPAYDPDRWQSSPERGIPLATEAQQARAQAENQRVTERVKQLNESLAELTTRFRKKLIVRMLATAAGGDGASDADLVERLLSALTAEETKRSDEQKKLIAERAPNVSLDEKALAQEFADFGEASKKLKSAVAAEEALRINVVSLRGLMDLDDKPHETHLLLRGDFNKPGIEVNPGVPVVLAPMDFMFAPQAGYKTSGRRKAFAEWLTTPDHPLTARTQVNRLWQHHFGRGLVPTVANLGHSGVPPAHPELLDWLASEFVASGWSQKALHRLIVLSTAFRQSSAFDERKEAADPDNVLLSSWRSRRVEGEVIRDAMLAVAGKLNLDMYGVPVPVALQQDGSVATADSAQGNRRSVYLKVRRSQHLTMLDLFDTPMMEINCPVRNESIVPLQALAMINGPFAELCGKSRGERVLREAGEDFTKQVDHAYRLLYARSPSAKERSALADFLAVCRADVPSDQPANALLDEKAAAAAAWSQLGLILLNTSEFFYVD